MSNLYIGTSLTRENGELTVSLEGVSVNYLQNLKLVALVESLGKNTLMFRGRDRKRTNITLEASSGDRDSWFQMLSAGKIVLKDYKNESVEANISRECYGLANSVVKTIQHLDELFEPGLKENLIREHQRRLAGFLK